MVDSGMLTSRSRAEKLLASPASSAREERNWCERLLGWIGWLQAKLRSKAGRFKFASPTTPSEPVSSLFLRIERHKVSCWIIRWPVTYRWVITTGLETEVGCLLAGSVLLPARRLSVLALKELRNSWRGICLAAINKKLLSRGGSRAC